MPCSDIVLRSLRAPMAFRLPSADFSTMDIGEEYLNNLLDKRWHLQSACYEVIACLTLTVYEWMLSFAEEVELIHRKRWTWFKALYLACRYLPFIGLASTAFLWVGNHTKEFCLPLLRYQNAALIELQVFPYVALLVRCYAFLGRRRWFLVFSIISVSLSSLIQIVGILGETCLVDDQFDLTGRYGCFRNWQTRESRYVGVVLLLPLVIDGISIIAVLRHHRKNGGVQSPLSNLFVQQAIFYFSVILTSSLIFGSFQLTGSTQLDGKALVTLLTIPNAMACRLILQLRRATAPLTPTEFGQQLSIVVRRDLHLESIKPPPS